MNEQPRCDFVSHLELEQKVTRLERMLDLAGAQNMGIDNLANLANLEQQLLQAQAAIAEHNEQIDTTVVVPTKITVDLSVLDKHDEQVRFEVWNKAAQEIEKLRHVLKSASAELGSCKYWPELKAVKRKIDELVKNEVETKKGEKHENRNT